MPKRLMMDAIQLEKAIQSKKKIIMAIHEPTSDPEEIVFHPYIMGFDLFRIPFVWGYSEEDNAFYKAYEDYVPQLEVTDEGFEVKKNVHFIDTIVDEIHMVVDGFEKNIWRESHVMEILNNIADEQP